MRKTVLITGCSSGIGRATAKLFQAEGWNVVATMRSPEKYDELKELPNVLVSELDVTRSETIRSTLMKSIDVFGGIDVLVNNAGYGAYGPLEAFDREGIQRQFDTNVLGLIEMTKAILPFMRESGAGSIINISSMGGRVTFPLGSLYHASKFAVEGFSEALQFELEPLGIRVKLIEPGIVKTDFGGRSFDFRNNEALREYQPTVEKLNGGFSAIAEEFGVLESADVAKTIYRAAIDESSRLRIAIGEDAKAFIKARQTKDDDDLLDRIGQFFK